MPHDPNDAIRAYCVACAYPLVGLSGTRCPECGRPFDLTDPATYESRPRRAGRRRQVGTVVVLLACPLSFSLTWLSGPVLLNWYFGRATGTLLGWGTRFYIGEVQAQFVFASALLAVGIAGAFMARGSRAAVLTRSLVWAAGLWWLGWVLSFALGWTLYRW